MKAVLGIVFVVFIFLSMPSQGAIRYMNTGTTMLRVCKQMDPYCQPTITVEGHNWHYVGYTDQITNMIRSANAHGKMLVVDARGYFGTHKGQVVFVITEIRFVGAQG
jgi:hypothetical protein